MGGFAPPFVFLPRDVAFQQVALGELWIAFVWRAVTTAARQAHFHKRVRGNDLLGLRILGSYAVDEDFAGRTGAAAAKTLGGVRGAVAEDRADEGLARADAEGDRLAQPAAVLARAARIVAQGLALHD